MEASICHSSEEQKGNINKHQAERSLIWRDGSRERADGDVEYSREGWRERRKQTENRMKEAI